MNKFRKFCKENPVFLITILALILNATSLIFDIPMQKPYHENVFFYLMIFLFIICEKPGIFDFKWHKKSDKQGDQK